MSALAASYAYALRENESALAAAVRLAGGRAVPLPGGGGVVELSVPLEGPPVATAHATALVAHVAARFPHALAVQTSESNGVRTTRVKTEEETFDVVARGDKVFVLTFDGFGGVDAIDGGSSENVVAVAFDRAYRAYRALLTARAL